MEIIKCKFCGETWDETTSGFLTAKRRGENGDNCQSCWDSCQTCFGETLDDNITCKLNGPECKRPHWTEPGRAC